MADHGITGRAVGEADIVDNAVSVGKLSAAVQDEILDIDFETGVDLHDGTGLITLHVVDAAGNAVEEENLITLWTSATAEGAATAVGTIVVDDGVVMETITENAMYQIMTDSSGLVWITLTASDGTYYVMARVGGKGGYGEIEVSDLT